MSEMTVVRTKTCCVCGNYELWSLDSKAVNKFKSGEDIQRAFPDMSAGDREILISGTHAICWDRLFPKEEEEENE